MARTVQSAGRSSDVNKGRKGEKGDVVGKKKIKEEVRYRSEKHAASPTSKSVKKSDKNAENRVKKEESVKKRKFRPGTVALREIRRLQKSTDALTQRMPMKRLVRSITQDVSTASDDMRWTRAAMDTICKSAEMFLIELFSEANGMCVHRHRVTVTPKDIMTALRSNSKNRLVYKNYLDKLEEKAQKMPL